MNHLNQYRQVQQQQGASRVVQTVTSLSNLSTVSQVITTTANTSNATRILQTVPTTVARITGMSLHPLPLVPVRATTAPVKAAQSQNIGQTVQIKSPQQTSLRVSAATGTNNSTVTTSAQPVQGQYIHPPHTTTYYSFESKYDHKFNNLTYILVVCMLPIIWISSYLDI